MTKTSVAFLFAAGLALAACAAPDDGWPAYPGYSGGDADGGVYDGYLAGGVYGDLGVVGGCCGYGGGWDHRGFNHGFGGHGGFHGQGGFGGPGFAGHGGPAGHTGFAGNGGPGRFSGFGGHGFASHGGGGRRV